MESLFVLITFGLAVAAFVMSIVALNKRKQKQQFCILCKGRWRSQ